MSHTVRSLTIATMTALALAVVPVVSVTVDPPGVAKADVCGDVGGRHVSAGGCVDPGQWVAPPPDDAQPQDEGTSPPPPAPDVTGCADVGGRHVSVGGCT